MYLLTNPTKIMKNFRISYICLDHRYFGGPDQDLSWIQNLPFMTKTVKSAIYEIQSILHLTTFDDVFPVPDTVL